MLANWAGDAILSPQLVLRFACCARFALTLAFFGLMSARSASGAAVAPARPPVPSSGAWCWRRGARRARVSDGATLALHAGREIVRLGERASGARDGGRRSFGALTGREEKSLLERVSGGSGFERHMDSQSDRSCTRVALSSRAGTGTLLGCGKVYACTWRQRGQQWRGEGQARNGSTAHTTAWNIAVRTAPRASALRQHRRGRRRENRSSPRPD